MTGRGEVALSAEDRYRMTRLHEEVLGRLHEMAAITARNTGMDLGAGYRVLFSPEPVRSGEAGRRPARPPLGDVAARFEIVCSSDPDGGCGYYYPDKGVCEICDEL